MIYIKKNKVKWKSLFDLIQQHLYIDVINTFKQIGKAREYLENMFKRTEILQQTKFVSIRWCKDLIF